VVPKAEHVALRNGLAVLAQPMGHVRSVAINLLIPAGFIHEAKGEEGIGNVLCEMLQRGAGKLDSRAFAQALDRLGIDLNCSVGPHHLRIGATGLADKLPEILSFMRDIVLHPKLPSAELSAAKALALQELLGLDDDPRGQALVELRRHHFPHPYSNNRYGSEEGIKGITHASLKAHWEKFGHAKGSILSVAGLIEADKVRDLAEKYFGDWAPGKEHLIKPSKSGPTVTHLAKDTQQTQIALAWNSVSPSHGDYYQAQGAVQVLSGGMSSRLFTEVREKQGLCYAVWASYVPLIDRGAIFCYAGTTNDRAHLTMEAVKKEIRRLKDGITKEEVERVKVGLKTSLLMQEDSSAARSSSMASDWFYLGRIRPLEEIEGAVAALTPKSILEFLAKSIPGELTQVTIGPDPNAKPAVKKPAEKAADKGAEPAAKGKKEAAEPAKAKGDSKVAAKAPAVTAKASAPASSKASAPAASKASAPAASKAAMKSPAKASEKPPAEKKTTATKTVKSSSAKGAAPSASKTTKKAEKKVPSNKLKK